MRGNLKLMQQDPIKSAGQFLISIYVPCNYGGEAR